MNPSARALLLLFIISLCALGLPSRGTTGAIQRLHLQLIARKNASRPFPQVVTSNTSAENSNVTTHTVSLPASIVSGDLLLCGACIDAAAVVSWPPSGWTETANVDADPEFVVAHKTASGSEGASFTFTTDVGQQSSHICLRISPWHGTTAPEIATATGTSTTPDPPSLNPAGWGTENTLWVAWACVNDGGALSFSAYPYADNNLSSVGSTSTGTMSAVATDELAQASEDPGTFTKTGASRAWVSGTTGVRP